MTRCGYLLAKLAEECNEVSQRALKAQIFGVDEVQPGQPYTNGERTMHEMADLMGVLMMLHKEGFVKQLSGGEMVERMEAKQAKVDRYYQIPLGRGLIDGVPADSNYVHPEAK